MDQSSNFYLSIMTFISYAQNFEDVMLWRALKNIENGFYIDVGAFSPDQDTVTKAFYERGWRGINIEPNPELFDKLKTERKHDINLRIALGEREEQRMMSFMSNPGLSTLNYEIAKKHSKSGLDLQKRKVTVRTLNDIWKEHVAKGQDVHFLKIDVEGLEKAVISGNDWKNHRPWVLLVEATFPLSRIEVFDEWEPMLTKANYKMVYADGLNRFYLAKERIQLQTAFRYPPNIFDEFTLAPHVALRAELDSVHRANHNHWSLLQESKEQLKNAEALSAEQLKQFQQTQNHYEKSLVALRQQHTEQLEQVRSDLQQRDVHISAIEIDLETTRNELHQVHQVNHSHWEQLQSTRAELDAIFQANHQHWLQAEERQQQINDLLASKSWRITAPLRGLKMALVWFLSLPLRTVKALIRPFIILAARFILKRPNMHARIFAILRRFPWLFAHARQFVLHRGLYHAPPTEISTSSPAATSDVSSLDSTELDQEQLKHLSCRARQISADLKAAVVQQQQQGR